MVKILLHLPLSNLIFGDHIRSYILPKKLGGLETEITTQRKFLIKMGIKERAEIISKNFNFTKKADIFYRLKRLIDEKEMGNIFKVMFIKNKTNKYKLGF